MAYLIEKWHALTLEGICQDSGYQISTLGRLRKWNSKTDEWKILKLSDSKGYKIVTLKSPEPIGSRITRPVHKLVAQMFLKSESPKHQFIIHLDFNKGNNQIDNLKWASRRDMVDHHKNNPNYKTGRRNYSKLSETEVIRIKHKLKRGKTALYKIAKEFGITHTQLNRIRSGENWSTVTID